jgi:hypothetical protein
MLTLDFSSLPLTILLL